VVAVRSSATAEDLPGASFAGQQETYLNINGIEQVLAAVKRCWASLWTARAIGYRARQGIGEQGLSLAVVVQMLVPAEAAGILFTANPVTGQREQAMISAAWGLGEAVVGGLVTPDSLIVDKASGTVVDRQTADKQVMTARIDAGTREQPVPAELRRAPVLDDQAAAELVQLGTQIEQLFGMPMDIEWALADGAFAILQARPITALPGPVLEPPTEWLMPNPKGTYMRQSIADFMPDPLTPLFSTLAVPAINEAMGRTMAQMIGGKTKLAENFLTTINHYAYTHINLGFRDWMWVLFRMLPAFPRLLRNGERHYLEVARPRYAQVADGWRERSPDKMSESEIFQAVDEITSAMADYLTTLQVDALGAAAGAEGVFTAIYNRVAKDEGDPPAATLLLGADSLPIQAEKALYDLALWCRQHSELAGYLLAAPSSRLVEQLSSSEAHPGDVSVALDDWRELQRRFRVHMAQYGYSIYDLDFAKPLPLDEPLPLLEALKLFVSGKGADPYKRQQSSITRREAAVEAALGKLRGLKLRLFRWSLRFAQTFTRLREDSIFEIGLGYPVLRSMLHELGRRFATAGAIDNPDEIYWLERDEVEGTIAAIAHDQEPENYSSHILHRKTVWRAEEKAAPPQQLPPKSRVMGIKADAFLPVNAEDQIGNVLKGVPASPGQVTANARLLLNTEDFSTMQIGDILVAEITTPAWTPLFAMASGVVTDIGGPLSHGSIVAREYGIPAVLGTGVATQRIRNGQRITVDGSAGTVTIL
jgi:pyruvate,water dikinase